MDYAEIYAVDFDGTLNLADTYPELGEPNAELIEFLKERRAAGDKIILWTCREGELLKAAVKYCNNYGLFFHAVNENLPENIAYFGNNCRKVRAHHYIDDKNMMPEIPGIEASQYHWEEKSKGILGIDMGNGPDMTVIAVSLLSDYENTGLTTEQIRELAERDTPKIPIYQVPGDERYEQEPEWWECPSCGEIYDMDEDCDFCPNCGQRLMW